MIASFPRFHLFSRPSHHGWYLGSFAAPSILFDTPLKGRQDSPFLVPRPCLLRPCQRTNSRIQPEYSIRSIVAVGREKYCKFGVRKSAPLVRQIDPVGHPLFGDEYQSRYGAGGSDPEDHFDVPVTKADRRAGLAQHTNARRPEFPVLAVHRVCLERLLRRIPGPQTAPSHAETALPFPAGSSA